MSTNPPAPEPQGPSEPVYQQQPAPGYAAAPPPASDYSAAPSGGRPKGSSTLGIIAFVAAIAAVVIGSILVFVGGQSIGAVIEYTGTSGTVDTDTLPPAALERATAGTTMLLLGWLAFAALGLWGLIQGIVAAVLNRGRGWGIAAIVIAVIGVVALIVFTTLGIGAGAAPYM